MAAQEQVLWMLYPTFQIVPGRGIIPDIRLPVDFRERVPKFYEQNGIKTLERYVESLRETLARRNLTGDFPPVDLQWSNICGLTNIGVGSQGGLDLLEDSWPRFQEHNLGGEAGYAAGFIAMKYISELLKNK